MYRAMYSDPLEKKMSCWVYLFRNNKDTTLQIGYSLDLPGLLRSGSETIYLLYYRQFNNVTDGLGHKALLERLSTASLHRIVRKENLEQENLTDKLIK